VPVATPAGVDLAPYPAAPGDLTVEIRLGPRADWFTPEAIATLCSATYTVSTHTDRIGARLSGPPLTRSVTGELRSEGLVLGAVQVPADGRPLIFLADHPTTGGYPVVGVAEPASVDAVAQARPGTAVRFRAVAGTLAQAAGR
jgi:allophanate hydrolase subunit 2